jgi:hypothetical protein
MLSENKVIALYCIVNDVLKAMRHQEDIRVRVTDSEIITTAFVSALYFHGHIDNVRMFMKIKGYVPKMLDKSRFCRRKAPEYRKMSPPMSRLFISMYSSIQSTNLNKIYSRNQS